MQHNEKATKQRWQHRVNDKAKRNEAKGTIFVKSPAQKSQRMGKYA